MKTTHRVVLALLGALFSAATSTAGEVSNLTPEAQARVIAICDCARQGGTVNADGSCGKPAAQNDDAQSSHQRGHR